MNSRWWLLPRVMALGKPAVSWHPRLMGMADVFEGLYGDDNRAEARRLGEAYDEMMSSADRLVDGVSLIAQGLWGYARAVVRMNRSAWRLRRAMWRLDGDAPRPSR